MLKTRWKRPQIKKWKKIDPNYFSILRKKHVWHFDNGQLGGQPEHWFGKCPEISQERDELVAVPLPLIVRESDHSLSGSGGRTGIPDIMIFSLFTDIKLIISSHSGSEVTTHISSLSSLSTWSSALLVLLLPDSLHAYILFGVDQNLGFLLPPNISLSWSWKVGSGSGRNIEESYQIKSSLPLAWMWINSACDMDPLQRGWEFWDKKQQVLWWDSGTKILILSFNTL